MGYNYQEHDGGDFGQPPDGELGRPMLANLGIGPFGGGAPLPVYGLGLPSGHTLPPPLHPGAVAVLSLPKE